MILQRLLLICFGLICLLSACSTPSATQVVDEAPEENIEKPLTYEEYKIWRDKNAPEARDYARFKEWEAEYRRFQARQQAAES